MQLMLPLLLLEVFLAGLALGLFVGGVVCERQLRAPTNRDPHGHEST